MIILQKNIKEHNPNWLKTLIICTQSQILQVQYLENVPLFNLLKHQNYQDYNIFGKIYLYVKDTNKAKSY